MLVKFIYHFPPVLLLYLLKLRRVYLPLGGRKVGDLIQNVTEGEKEDPGLSLREQRNKFKSYVYVPV